MTVRAYGAGWRVVLTGVGRRCWSAERFGCGLWCEDFRFVAVSLQSQKRNIMGDACLEKYP